jgi:hypothetical protein
MNTIYKYVLPIHGEVKLKVPSLFRPLYIGTKEGELCLWALVDPSTLEQTRIINIYGTGQPVELMSSFDYIGSCIMPNGLVWHVVDGGRI